MNMEMWRVRTPFPQERELIVSRLASSVSIEHIWGLGDLEWLSVSFFTPVRSKVESKLIARCCTMVGLVENALEEIKEKMNPDRIIIESR